MSEPSTNRSRADATDREVTLRGRKVVGGVAEGKALVTRGTISGWGGMDAMTGTIIEHQHELEGQSFAGKVLVFLGAKGSSAYSAYFKMASIAGVAPAAMIFTHMSTKAALGAVVSRVPAVTDLDADPFAVIQTGDWVRVDADRGVVTVLRQGERPLASAAEPSTLT
jgi:uncharacterized protein